VTPQEWFDQFPHPPAKFTRSLKRAVDAGKIPQWCWRHWAPCPELHANGILASVMVMQRFVDANAVTPLGAKRTTAEMNAKLRELSPVCCVLGDEVMYEIWGQCPPA
jgi:hypothetical protein